MTLSQVKKACREIQTNMKKRVVKNYYLIKYPNVSWTIGTPEENSTDNVDALDTMVYSLYGEWINEKFYVREY